MNIQFIKNKIILSDIKNFDLQKTFECGQCFRFDKVGDSWQGVAYGKLLTLTEADGKIEIDGITENEFNSTFRTFFDLERDYCEIDRILSQDKVLSPIVPFSTGIRILRQDRFETLVSFIISASNNIPRIKKIIGLLCQSFGDEFTVNGQKYYSFPSATRLASLNVEDLAVIRSGFRDKYILDCAKKVASGEINLDAISKMPYKGAQKELMKINGIGAKVADCALLFGFGFFESFPKDVWIKRILLHYYGTETNAGLDFHGLDGIAQQYLFYYARETSLK